MIQQLSRTFCDLVAYLMMSLFAYAVILIDTIIMLVYITFGIVHLLLAVWILRVMTFHNMFGFD